MWGSGYYRVKTMSSYEDGRGEENVPKKTNECAVKNFFSNKSDQERYNLVLRLFGETRYYI